MRVKSTDIEIFAGTATKSAAFTMKESKDNNVARATSIDLGHDYGTGSGSGSSKSPIEAHSHGHPEIIADVSKSSADRSGQIGLADSEGDKRPKTLREKLAFFKTRDFWFILALGQVLAICITGTNTLTSLMVIEGTSVPAFQTLFNYILLNVVYTGYTIYKYGFRKWGRMVVKDGWKCMFFSSPVLDWI